MIFELHPTGRERRIIVVHWEDEPEEPQWEHSVTCEHCETDLLLPSAPGTRIIASKGMAIIFDNTLQPPNAIPDSVRCPACRREYEMPEVTR
jgi:hypothetical protein